MDYNLHTHNQRCHHATGEPEDYVIAAIEGGMKVYIQLCSISFEQCSLCTEIPIQSLFPFTQNIGSKLSTLPK